jgi:hypothetical protein
MKKLFLGLSVLFGVGIIWSLYEYFISPYEGEAMMILVFGLSPAIILFFSSLFLWFRESKVSLNKTNSFDRVFRVVLMFVILLVLLFLFFPGVL